MKRAIVLIVVILLALIATTAGAILFAISRMQDDSIPIVDAEDAHTPIPEMFVLDVDPAVKQPQSSPAPILAAPQADENIINILLIGGDSRANTASAIGNSDTILLLSINKYTNTVTLLSFLRDGWVEILTPGGTYSGKLNAAHADGGHGALINTLNHNFSLDIQSYVAIGFENFTTLIDRLGGIDVDLTAAEAHYINWKMEDTVLEETDGVAHLTGEQALWYARNRTTPLADESSGNDFSRVTRQQHLVELMLAKARNEMDADMVFEFLRFAIENCSTNLTAERMGEIGAFLMSNDCTLVKAHVPFDGTWNYRQGGGIAFNVADAASRVHALLYPAALSPEG